jgi:hypothetical protein
VVPLPASAAISVELIAILALFQFTLDLRFGYLSQSRCAIAVFLPQSRNHYLHATLSSYEVEEDALFGILILNAED